MFWSFWLAISEPGWTSRKKVPLGIRLKSTRPSHGRVCSSLHPPEARQNFRRPGLWREGYEIGPCRAPLLASCSWLGWLFSFALSHDPAVESGPHSLARVCNGSSVTSLGPDCCTGCRCARVVRHLRLSWPWVGWWLRRRERGRRVGVFCLKGVWLSQCRFTSARFIPHFMWRKMWCGCVGSSRLVGLRVFVSTRGTAQPTRHCQAQARRNGLVIVFRGRKMHQGQTSGNFCLSVPYDIPIISQKNAHNHSKEAPSMNFTSTNKNFAPTWCVWSDVRRGWQAQAPLAVTFRFHVPVGGWKK